MPGSIEVYFATSNVHKFAEARLILRGTDIALRRLPSKGTEIQSDEVSEIAVTAASEAYTKHRRPLFVEDTMLSVQALNGFPGAYGSYVYRTLGPAGILRLLADEADRRAAFVSAVAFADGVGQPHVFLGRLDGSIAEQTRGSGGFGFDKVFVPGGRSSTLAEMTMEEKCAISHRSKAVRAFASWYLSSRRRQRL